MRRLQRGKTAGTHARRRSEKLTLLSCRRAEVSFKIKDHSLLVSCQQHHAEFYLLNNPFSQLLMLYFTDSTPAQLPSEQSVFPARARGAGPERRLFPSADVVSVVHIPFSSILPSKMQSRAVLCTAADPVFVAKQHKRSVRGCCRFATELWKRVCRRPRLLIDC